MKCPKCGSNGPFTITNTCTSMVSDDGIEDSWDHEWSNEDPCICCAEGCSFYGNVDDFRVKKTYRVVAREVNFLVYEVQAIDEEEAERLVEEDSDGRFNYEHGDGGGWEIVKTEEVKS
jgi:hypothetical protein